MDLYWNPPIDSDDDDDDDDTIQHNHKSGEVSDNGLKELKVERVLKSYLPCYHSSQLARRRINIIPGGIIRMCRSKSLIKPIPSNTLRFTSIQSPMEPLGGDIVSTWCW
ncbi:hypothetical protein ACTFIY_009514 [Dictyostelium cf. discoideum]